MTISCNTEKRFQDSMKYGSMSLYFLLSQIIDVIRCWEVSKGHQEEERKSKIFCSFLQNEFELLGMDIVMNLDFHFT